MADAVATQTIQDGGQTAIFRFTNISDGTGESAVTKIDVSGLTTNPMTKMACNSVSIEKIWFSNIYICMSLPGLLSLIFFNTSFQSCDV